MAKRANSLKPGDVVVALRLALHPGAIYDELSSALGISKSAAFRAVERLEKAGLLVPGERTVMKHALREFIAHGLRYAFYAEPGPEVLGIPTAHSAPPLADEFSFEKYYVWPSPAGVVRGSSVLPLFSGAPEMPARDPMVYQGLALLDAVRLGQVRERKRALELLDGLLEQAPTTVNA